MNNIVGKEMNEADDMRWVNDFKYIYIHIHT